jgi:chromosome segregation ATPase
VSSNPVQLLTPEQSELDRKRAELSALEEQLAECELVFATLQNELCAFEHEYMRAVGALYAELDEVEARIAEAQARHRPLDASLRDRAARARAKAAQTAADVNSTPEGLTDRPKTTEALKKLYREIARSVHPDLAHDEASRSRRTQLMAEANHAYAEGNASRLDEILARWRTSPDAVEGDGIASELIRTIRKIHQVHRRLMELESAVTGLQGSPLHRLWFDVTQAEARGEDPLGELRRLVEQDLDAAKERWTAARAGDAL